MSNNTDGLSSTRSAQASHPLISRAQETILSRVDSSVSASSTHLSALQSQVDGLVGGFVQQATDWHSLAAMMTGGLAGRAGRIGTMSLSKGLGGQALSVLGGLTAEVSAFELTNRTLHSMEAPLDRKNPNLWSWSGQGGLRQGFVQSLIAFGALKSAGVAAQGENILVQHLAQYAAMVLGHHVAGVFDTALKPTGHLSEQFLHAEAMNLQMGAGIALAYHALPLMSAFEKGMNLSLGASGGVANPEFVRKGFEPALATANGAPIPNASEAPSPLPTNLMAMSSKKGDDGGKIIPFPSRGPQTMSAPAEERSPAPEKPEGPIKLIALGDIHAKWPRVQSILDHEFPDGKGHVLSVGDLVNYPQLPKGIEFFFVHGNHENFHVVDSLHRGSDPARANYHPIFAGDLIKIGGLTVAGLPGVFSEYFYSHPNEAAPLTYWTPERVGAFGELPHRIDILLMHEAPKDIGFKKGDEDLGNPLLTSLIEFLNPRLAFFGHHHQRFEGKLGETRVIGLDYPKRSYVVLEYDPVKEEIRWTTVEGHLTANPKNPKTARAFKFPWEAPEKEDTVFMPQSSEVIPMDREKRMEALLKEKHVETGKSELTQTILAELQDSTIDDKPFAARIRASSSVNTVLPFVARYAAALEANPKMPLEKRQELIGKAYDEMTKGLMPQASPDLVRAFEGLLKALGIVKA